MNRFADRVDAGRQLAAKVVALGLESPVVLALPRGGVPVAAEVAAALGAPLDILVVRKVGVPWHPELGVGALAEGGEPMLDEDLMRRVGVSTEALEPVIARERAELARRVHDYRGGRPAVDVAGRVVVLVDDGIATGGTARAALRALRERGAAQLVLAVPVAGPDTVERMQGAADLVVVVSTPTWFSAVGQAYDDFRQTTDDEVLRLLHRP